MFSRRKNRQNNNLGNIELINRNYLRNEYKGLMTKKQYNYFVELNKIKPLKLAIGAGDTGVYTNEKETCDIEYRSLEDFDMFLYFSENNDNDYVKVCKKYLQNKEDELGNTREYQIVKVDLSNKEYVNFIFGTFKFIHIEGIDNTFAFINESDELLYNILNSLVNEGTFTNSDIFGFTIVSNLYNLNKNNINKEKNNFISTIREKIGNNFIQNISIIKIPHTIIEPQIIFDIIILPLFELNIITELENNFRTFINNNNNNNVKNNIIILLN